MDRESITKGILSGIISRYLKEIGEDPYRSIRKLVDMAERTSDGPTQKICYQMMQQMAEDQSSPYYDMICHLAAHTAPETIRQCGINLGHNAWTFGSGNIRQILAKKDIPLSWIMLIDRQPDANRIGFTEIEKLVAQGRSNEIYAWMLLTSGELEEWALYRDLFRAHPDCIFGLCLDPRAVSESLPEEAADIPNLMFILNTDEPKWRSALHTLSNLRCLRSVYRRISGPEQVEDVISGKWLESVSELRPLMAFTLTDVNCPEETARKVSRYMWDTRLNQEYPVLPADMISDFLIINRLVTLKEVLCRIAPDGSVRVEKIPGSEPEYLTIRELLTSQDAEQIPS